MAINSSNQTPLCNYQQQSPSKSEFMFIFCELISMPYLWQLSLISQFDKFINKMSKCEHGQKIVTFCATECCVWKDAGGCSSCMKKYHNHMGPTVFVSEEQANKLVKKYQMEPCVKPKCRNLQQLIFNYFNLIKTEFDAYIDNACIDIMNQIGHPYLTQSNLFPTYKRLKKKDFKKVQQKDFRTFYEASCRVDSCELIEKESKIYMQKVKNKCQFINRIEGLIKNFEKENKENQVSYVLKHDHSIHLRINEMMQSILNTSEGQELKEHKHKQSPAFKDINQSRTQNQGRKQHETLQINTPGKLAKCEESSDLYGEEQDPFSLQGQQRHRLRANSIDRQLLLSSKLQRKIENKQRNDGIGQNQTASDRQAESHLPMSKGKDESLSPSPRKRYFDKKEVEISQKKQKLIDMMRQRDEIQTNQLRGANPHQLQVPTSSYGNTEYSERSADEELLDLNHDPQQFAHAVLPRSESKRQIFQETAQKTFIVPVKSSIEAAQLSQCQSPLFKNKLKSKEREPIAAQQNRNKSFQILPKKMSDYEKQKDNDMDLSERQEKSVAFLIQSFSLKSQQAIPYLKKALEYSEDNLSAAQYLSYLYLQINQPKECLSLCNKMLEKLRDSTDRANLSVHLAINKSSCLNMLGRYSQSILISEECLRHEPSQKIYKNLGDAYYSIGILEKAAYSYEKSVSLCDDYDEAHYNLAVCLFSQKNYHNAKFSIAKALQYNASEKHYLQLQKQINGRIKEV